MNLDPQTKTELEAAAFRRLTRHLREHVDVQNIDLMNLVGFCRNCLSKWLKEEADSRGLAIGLEDFRQDVYGMPYAQWKELYQREASPDQTRAFAAVVHKDA